MPYFTSEPSFSDVRRLMLTQGGIVIDCGAGVGAFFCLGLARVFQWNPKKIPKIFHPILSFLPQLLFLLLLLRSGTQTLVFSVPQSYNLYMVSGFDVGGGQDEHSVGTQISGPRTSS